MKRFLVGFLAACLLLGCLAGCGKEQSQSGNTTLGQTDTPPTSTAPVQTTQPEGAELLISEVMPDNKYVTLGHAQDWVELYNREETVVELDGYYLTDDPENPYALPLTGLQIEPDGYLVITLGEDAPFRLSGEGETLWLMFGKTLISTLTYEAPQDGESFDKDGACQYPTPGYANSPEGYEEYLQNLKLPALIISEIMSSNSLHYPVGGECYDMIEIKNNSQSPIDLSGYTLTDKRSEPQRYQFPAVVLQPGEFYVVYCSGEPKLGANHTSFKLSADGETVYLAANGNITDALSFPADLGKNSSYGRIGSVPMYLLAPSFGEENTEGFRGAMLPPEASSASGYYDQTVTVELTGQGDIYFTLDGSRPTVHSQKYTGPITVTGVTTLRTFCTDGVRTSAIKNYTYLVGVSHSLPVVNVAIPQASLTGDTGVLNHINQDYEHEAVLTLIENGEEKFSVPFGFRLHGNDSRKGAKQNFQLRFRSEYGAGKLHYKLFDNLDITQFNSLLLKGGSEDWPTAVIRDELATAIVTGTTNLYTQAIKPVALYLGGQYWGVYFLRERFSDDYVADHFNVSPESVDILYSSGGSVQTGSKTDFQNLKAFVSSHDMSLDENFQYLTDRIDLTSLIDWYACRSYMGDRDTANCRRFRSSEYDSKWRWMYFDLDWSFWHTTDNPISSIMASSGGDHILIHGVLANAQGRELFLKRYAELMGTILNEEYIIGVIDGLVAQIEEEMVQDRARWGREYTTWLSKVEVLRNYVRGGARTANVLRDMQNYFGLTDDQMQYYFGNVMN